MGQDDLGELIESMMPWFKKQSSSKDELDKLVAAFELGFCAGYVRGEKQGAEDKKQELLLRCLKARVIGNDVSRIFEISYEDILELYPWEEWAVWPPCCKGDIAYHKKWRKKATPEEIDRRLREYVLVGCDPEALCASFGLTMKELEERFPYIDWDFEKEYFM